MKSFFPQMLVGDRNLFKWTHIFIDEVHERDQTMDFVLLLLKKLCSEIPATTTKIVLMSATVDIRRFCEYFATYQVRWLQSSRM